ncbi:MAG TPA: hypothetical protein VIY29_07415 [Ktedonobacteraceae bacterium]
MCFHQDWASSAYFQCLQVLTAAFLSSFGIFPLGGILFLAVGTILLGVAVLRAKVFPTMVGTLLLASAVLNLLGFVFQSGLLATLVSLLSTIVSAVAYGWVGTMLVQQSGMSGGEAAYQPQTALAKAIPSATIFTSSEAQRDTLAMMLLGASGGHRARRVVLPMQWAGIWLHMVQ